MQGNRDRIDHHLRVLVDVVQRMSRDFALLPLLQAAEHAGRSALKCDRATIFLYDPDTDELYSEVATGTTGIRFSAKLGIAGESARTRSVLVVPDAYADARFNPEIDKRTGYRTHNILSVPLLMPDGEVIGVLQLLNKVGGRFDSRDEMLAEALGSLIAIAIKRQILLDAAAERDRLEHELDIARQIQMQMLPKEKPSIPRFDVAGWNRPAEQTGGDCFSFFPLDNGRLLFLVADASGHGIGPALVVTQCRAMVRALSDQVGDLPAMVERLNRLLTADLSSGRFVTACTGVLDSRNNLLNYISAGHGPLLFYRAATQQVEILGSTGLPMAIMEDAEYRPPTVIEFGPDDMFCLMTDGFTEWARPDGELYGEQRLIDVIHSQSLQPAEAIIQAIYQDVLRFSEGTRQADDLTAVIIRRTS